MVTFLHIPRQFGLTDPQDARISTGIHTAIDEKLEGSIGKDRHCFFYFRTGGKPASRVPKCQWRDFHDSSSPDDGLETPLRWEAGFPRPVLSTGRIVSPLSWILWLWERMRSMMASPSVGLPMRACQSSTVN